MYFELFKEPSGIYFYRLVGDYLRSIIMRDCYQKKETALLDIETIKKNITANQNIELKTTITGKYFFEVKDTEGRIVGQSSLYKNKEALQQKLAALKQSIRSAKSDRKSAWLK